MDDRQIQEALNKAFANIIICEHIPPDKVFVGGYPIPDPNDFDIRCYSVITDII